MIKKDGIYKLKKLNIPGINNISSKFKVINEYDKDVVECENLDTGETFLFLKSHLVDPDNMEDDSYPTTVIEQCRQELLNMPTMNLSLWKEIQEEMGGASAGASTGGVSAGGMATGMSALGATPTPAMGQVMAGNSSFGAMVNGVPVEGYSVKFGKKKKKKKHEDYITGRELQDWDWQQRQTALYNQIGSPKQIFAAGKDEDIPLEFEDAINILLYGKDEDDRREYKELLYLFKDTGRMKEFINYANNKGFKDLSPKVIGKQEESLNIVNPEIEDIVNELLQEDFHEDYERITNLLAKQLDRMNFEYANTEEIIYKKEGQYKYLLKFDNKDGYLKFKISKDDEPIEVREWRLDEGDDISPIFKEIEELYNKYGI